MKAQRTPIWLLVADVVGSRKDGMHSATRAMRILEEAARTLCATGAIQAERTAGDALWICVDRDADPVAVLDMVYASIADRLQLRWVVLPGEREPNRALTNLHVDHERRHELQDWVWAFGLRMRADTGDPRLDERLAAAVERWESAGAGGEPVMVVVVRSGCETDAKAAAAAVSKLPGLRSVMVDVGVYAAETVLICDPDTDLAELVRAVERAPRTGSRAEYRIARAPEPYAERIATNAEELAGADARVIVFDGPRRDRLAEQRLRRVRRAFGARAYTRRQ